MFTKTKAPLEADDIDVGEQADDYINSGGEDTDDERSIFSDEEMPFDGSVHDDTNEHLRILPMYSLLDPQEQMKIFNHAEDGGRTCVVATNVAETSLTIPNIVYVVDCGRVKERHHEDGASVQSFRVQWTSKSSATQRAGRAGRTSCGHCYRLYSSAVYERDFPDFTVAEILRIPIEGMLNLTRMTF